MAPEVALQPRPTTFSPRATQASHIDSPSPPASSTLFVCLVDYQSGVRREREREMEMEMEMGKGKGKGRDNRRREEN